MLALKEILKREKAVQSFENSEINLSSDISKDTFLSLIKTIQEENYNYLMNISIIESQNNKHIIKYHFYSFENNGRLNLNFPYYNAFYSISFIYKAAELIEKKLAQNHHLNFDKHEI